MLPVAIAAFQAASSYFGGSEPAGPVLSGGGTFQGGGINVGSKVVGSGSAATAFPSPASGGGGFFTDNSATAGGLPKWFVPAALGAAVLLVVLLFRRKRKSK